MELLISARAITSAANLDSEDTDVAGVYSIVLDEEVKDANPGTQAGIALDVFHSNVPVSCLDDFEFLVINPSTMEVLWCDPDYEDYTGEGYGEDLELTGRRVLKGYIGTGFNRSRGCLGTRTVAAHNKREAKRLLKALMGPTAYSIQFNKE